MVLGTRVQGPKDDPAPATVLYHSRRRDPSGDIRHAGQTSVTTPEPRDLVRIVHAILKGQDRGFSAHEGRQRPRRLFGVVRLDGKEDQVNRGNLIRAGDERRMYFQVFLNASYPQTMLLHRLQVLAAGDEGHIHAGGCHSGPEISSDGACPHHRNSHVPFPLPFSVMACLARGSSLGAWSARSSRRALPAGEARWPVGSQGARIALAGRKRRALPRRRRDAEGTPTWPASTARTAPRAAVQRRRSRSK